MNRITIRLYEKYKQNLVYYTLASIHEGLHAGVFLLPYSNMLLLVRLCEYMSLLSDDLVRPFASSPSRVYVFYVFLLSELPLSAYILIFIPTPTLAGCLR